MATLYFNGAADIAAAQPVDWQTLGNWWTDEAFTIPAASLPGSIDDVTIKMPSGTVTNSGPTPTVNNLTVISDSSVVAIELSINVNGITNLATLGTRYGGSSSPTLNGNVDVNGGSLLDSIVNGTVNINNSDNYGISPSTLTTINGNVSISASDMAYASNFTINGNLTLKGGGSVGNGNNITINGSVILEDYSALSLMGLVLLDGDVNVYDYSSIYSYETYGTAITGNINLYDYAYTSADTIFDNILTLNDYSYIEGTAEFYGSCSIILNDYSYTDDYSDDYGCNGGSVPSIANSDITITFNDFSYSKGLSGDDYSITFNDSSYNLGCFQGGSPNITWNGLTGTNDSGTFIGGKRGIYVRTTGDDNTGNGTQASPFLTAQKGFETAYNDSGIYYMIDFGSGSFGGVNLVTANAIEWPVRISVRGVSSSVSNLGGINGNGIDSIWDYDNSVELIASTNGSNIAITSNNTINLGNISSTGGDETEIEGPSNGGDITLTDCDCGDIVCAGSDYVIVSGGDGGSIFLTNTNADSLNSCGGVGGTINSGNGGNVTLINSSVNIISCYGGHALEGVSGNGGDVVLNNSTASIIDASGGSIDAGYTAQSSGSGGSIIISNSTTATIYSNGGSSSTPANQPIVYGSGGSVQLTNSNTGSISSGGGSSNSPTGTGGNGGSVTLTNSVCVDINTGGGQSNQAGAGGNVVASDSTIGNIGTGTQESNDGNYAGSVTLTRCICQNINTNSANYAASNPGGPGSITLTDCKTVGSLSSVGGYNTNYSGWAGNGTITLIGSTVIPNNIRGNLVTTNLKKGRGVNGSNILGLI